MTVLVFLDPSVPAGRIVDAAVPALMATDQGATRGDGVFESLLVVGGNIRKSQAHLDRLDSSARAMDLQVPAQDQWRRAMATAVKEFRRDRADASGSGNGSTTNDSTTNDSTTNDSTTNDDEMVLKLIVTRGVEGGTTPTAWVQASEPPAAGRAQRETGVDVLLLDRGYDSSVADRAPWLLLGAKTLSYAVNMAALRYARAHGADDVIFTSGDGRVLEGPTSSVLLAHAEGDGPDRIRRLITPRLDSGILPGTSQGALFTAAKAAGWELGYGPVEPADLFDADAVWLISSVRLLAPVNRIDGREIGTPDARRALTTELNKLIAGTQ
ncbi:aminodeoxychorismate lyase [Paeniglutamicibacter antarcticus]|uniref:Aminodeoxychorismate lyase n=1 Tax=Arthrobacter terrae TaxID=2935737 RepID=A0A931CQX1_9MICC|nr:aminodeoxychorismate lyase [Arthrobacter terrae]MBG0740910.1 aminodeoxychorismate lyase [Arthrobacter terrae]